MHGLFRTDAADRLGSGWIRPATSRAFRLSDLSVVQLSRQGRAEQSRARRRRRTKAKQRDAKRRTGKRSNAQPSRSNGVVADAILVLPPDSWPDDLNMSSVPSPGQASHRAIVPAHETRGPSPSWPPDVRDQGDGNGLSRWREVWCPPHD
nr:hypothetical protein CFP56_02977 [Quercus suber]